MGKKGYGFSTAIPYGTDIFEVTGTEYCEWEDALEKAGSDSNAMEWATYDFLIGNGYFVSQPKGDRPKAGEKASKKADKKAETLKPQGVMSPGIRGVPDGFDSIIECATREPVWTQSRIFQERDKLLREREKIQVMKEKALDQKIVEQQLLERLKLQERGSPSLTMTARILGGVFILMLLIFIGIITNFK